MFCRPLLPTLKHIAIRQAEPYPLCIVDCLTFSPESFVVSVTTGEVEIVLRKSTPHENWEQLGNYLPGHGQTTLKQKRGVCVCVCVCVCTRVCVRYTCKRLWVENPFYRQIFSCGCRPGIIFTNILPLHLTATSKPFFNTWNLNPL